MAKRRIFDLMLLLQIALGIFFLVSGIMSILDYDSVGNTIKGIFGDSEVMLLIVGIVMIVCGVIIIGSLFLKVRSKSVYIALWTVFVLWLVTIVLNDFLNVNYDAMNIFATKTDLGLKNAFIYLFSWLKDLSIDLVVLSSILIVKNRGSV